MRIEKDDLTLKVKLGDLGFMGLLSGWQRIVIKKDRVEITDEDGHYIPGEPIGISGTFTWTPENGWQK